MHTCEERGILVMKLATDTTPNQKLRHERELRFWSQSQVAEKIGTSTLNVSRWERGVTTPNLYFRRQLCDLFAQSATELGIIPTYAVYAAARDDDPDHSTALYSSPIEPLFSTTWNAPVEPAVPPPPPPASGMVGRDGLLRQIKQRLLSDEPLAIAALHGLPGVGKTALAIQIAHDRDVLAHFRDGVLWAGLGPTPNVPGLLAGWGAALGITAPDMSRVSTTPSWARLICSTIGSRRMLLIADDAWTVEEGVTFKIGGPNCAHLFTTRFPNVASHVAGEGAIAVRELDEDESMRLLTRIAEKVVALEPGEAHLLMRSIGGLPLAITLIGNYLRVMAYTSHPRRVLAALDQLHSAEDRLRLAESQAPRERPPYLPANTPLSLRAAIAVTDQRLPSDVKAALRALSVFPPKPNSFGEQAALAVSASTVEALDALTDAGLLELRGRDRYTMHQTISDYARLELTDTAAYDRMVAYYVRFVEEHAKDFRVLEIEADNILTALREASARRHSIAFPMGVRAFVPFLLARGSYPVAKLLLEQARTVATSNDDDLSLTMCGLYLGRITELQGDLAAAERWYENTVVVARRIEDWEALCALLAHWGEVAINRGAHERAEKYLREGLALARQRDDQRHAAIMLRLLGEAADIDGQYVLGDALYQEGLALARIACDQENVSALLQNLGEQRMNRGKYEQADTYFREGIEHARAIGHRQRLSALLNGLGALEHRRGHIAQADILFQASLHLASSIENRVRVTNVLLNRGRLEADNENPSRAKALFLEGLEIAREIGHPFLMSESLCLLGDLYLSQRNAEATDAAFAVFSEASAIVDTTGAPEMGTLAVYGLARVAAIRGDLATACRLGQACLQSLQLEEHEKTNEVAEWLNTVLGTQAHPNTLASSRRLTSPSDSTPLPHCDTHTPPCPPHPRPGAGQDSVLPALDIRAHVHIPMDTSRP